MTDIIPYIPTITALISSAAMVVLGLRPYREVRLDLATKELPRLKGLHSDYGCNLDINSWVVELDRDELKLHRFGGKWRCCKLGCGGWGCAYKCEDSQGRVVVFKVRRGYEQIIEVSPQASISYHNLKDLLRDAKEETPIFKGSVEEVRKRAKDLLRINHQNILKLLDYSEVAPILIYEYANQGSLDWQLKSGWKPSLRDVLIITTHLANGLRYLHSRGLVHSDIKPANVFIVDGIAKLGDFSGLVKLLSSNQVLTYTIGWRAPEQVYADLRDKAKREGFENRIDIYQLGNLILYLLTGRTIDGEYVFDGEKRRKLLNKIKDSELRKLVSEMLESEASKRPSADEVYKKLLTLLSRSL